MKTKRVLKHDLDDSVVAAIRQAMGEPDVDTRPFPHIDWNSFNAAVDDRVEYDREHPDPDRSRLRWARIKALRQEWRAGWQNEQGKKFKKGELRWFDTFEGHAVASESHWLHAIERTTALWADWPVWQEGQHFKWLTPAGVLMEGEVVSFDTWTGLIECHFWGEDDLCASLAIKTETRWISTGMIVAGEREDDRRGAARQKDHEARKAQLALEKSGGQQSLFDAIPNAE